MCILALRRVCVHTCARARLQLTYVAMAIIRKQSQFMIHLKYCFCARHTQRLNFHELSFVYHKYDMVQ